MASSNYNDIYSSLVGDRSNEMGLIAYAIYKKQKIEWIENFKANNQGALPEEDDYKGFYIVASTKQSLNSYRQSAKEVVEALEESTNQKHYQELLTIKQKWEDEKEKIDKECKTYIENKLLEREKTPFSIGIFQSLIASVIFVIIVGFALPIFERGLKSDPTSIFKKSSSEENASKESNSTNQASIQKK